MSASMKNIMAHLTRKNKAVNDMDYYDILYFASLSRGKKKKEYIEEHKDDPYFRDALFYALNPFVTYGVSRATLMKYMKPFKDPIISSKKSGTCSMHANFFQKITRREHIVLKKSEAIFIPCMTKQNLNSVSNIFQKN